MYIYIDMIYADIQKVTKNLVPGLSNANFTPYLPLDGVDFAGDTVRMLDKLGLQVLMVLSDHLGFYLVVVPLSKWHGMLAVEEDSDITKKVIIISSYQGTARVHHQSIA